MTFHRATLRVKELAEAIGIDCDEIIATCIILKIPASSPLTTLSLDQCKKIIYYLKKE